ncbi:p100 2L [African swine fever virus]|uniref:p100 2L n=1 Tax=African swine fever virus TaxID=10497 RepID=A0A894KPC9_ASF|nr:p100 2L [African swine fever virus]QST87229.1 p100_2L [African swine fever virus]
MSIITNQGIFVYIRSFCNTDMQIIILLSINHNATSFTTYFTILSTPIFWMLYNYHYKLLSHIICITIRSSWSHLYHVSYSYKIFFGMVQTYQFQTLFYFFFLVFMPFVIQQFSYANAFANIGNVYPCFFCAHLQIPTFFVS